MAPGYLLRRMDDADPDDLAELLDRGRGRDVYFSAPDDEKDPVGFFQFENTDGTVDVGLGLRLGLTGMGLGEELVLSGLAFARERFSPERLTLSVAAFNKRAAGVYGRPGFRRGGIYLHETNGGEHGFLRMERRA